jgi:hypothetical protein
MERGTFALLVGPMISHSYLSKMITKDKNSIARLSRVAIPRIPSTGESHDPSVVFLGRLLKHTTIV